jgi:hypothetical protein
MSLVTINRQPNRKELRNFGLAAVVMLTIIALLLHRLKGLGTSWTLGICGAGLLIFIISRINVRLIKPVYVTLTLLTAPIGWVVSFIIMAVFYYLVIMPTGLFFRLMGRDALHLKFDRSISTYWVVHRKADSVRRYFNQF